MRSGPEEKTLRDLSLPIRLVLAVFLVSVGFGYTSALVQLHFKEAMPGEMLPTAEDAIRTYYGKREMGQLERVITEPENRPWGAGGTMRPAFTTESAGWDGNWSQTRDAFLLPDNKAGEAAAKELMRTVRYPEIQVVLAWIRDGAKKETYDTDQVLDAKLAEPLNRWQEKLAARPAPKEGEELPLPPSVPHLFRENEDEPDPNKKWQYNVKRIIGARCARCHAPGRSEGHIDLSSYNAVLAYLPPVDDPSARGMSLSKLAQTTHVHLLGFSMLYGLTGLFFAFTSYPLLLRLLLAPLPLLVQMVDISFWWLARTDAPYGPAFATAIPITGGIVAVGLLLQIVLGLFALFGWTGRFVIVALMVGVLAGGHLFVKPIVDRHLKWEHDTMMKEPAEPKESKTDG